MLVVLLISQKDYEHCTIEHVNINDAFLRGWRFSSWDCCLREQRKASG